MRSRYVAPERPPPRGSLERARYDREQELAEARERIDRKFAETVQHIMLRDDLTRRKAGEGIGMSHVTVIKLLKMLENNSERET